MADIKHLPDFLMKHGRIFASLLIDTFQTINKDAGRLFQVVVVYSFSLMFIALLFAHVYLESSARIENLFYLHESVSKPRLIMTILTTLFYAASFCTLTCIITLFLYYRMEDPEKSHRELFTELKANFFNQLKNYAPNFIIIYFIYIIITYGLAYAEPLYLFTDYGDFDFGPFNSELNWLLRNVLSIVILPLFTYFAFSALYLSVRDHISSSDAFKKIYELSKSKLKQVWLYGILLLLLVSSLDGLIRFRSGEYLKVFPFHIHLWFVVLTLKKMMSFIILIFLQVASITLFCRLEKEPAEEPGTPENI